MTIDSLNLNFPDPAADMLRRREGFLSSPKWDVNHLRAGYGSDTMTDAEGRIHEVNAATHVSRADAERDLRRREFETQAGVIDKIGPDAWFRLTPEAQTALTDIAYNYGHLPQNVLAAARTGDPSHLAQSIAARRGDNGGVNNGRRMEEARMVLAGGEGEIEQPPDPTKDVKSSWDWPKPQAKTEAAPTAAPAKAAGASWAWPKPGEKPGEKSEAPSLWDRYLKLATRGLSPEEAKNVRSMIEHSPPMQLLGAASGALQLGTKAAGLLPNEWGGKQAVEATKALEQVGPKEGQVAGELAAGAALPIGRAAGLVSKAAGEAAPIAAETSRLSQIVSGAKEGAAVGAGFGAATGGGTEEDYTKRLGQKARGALEGAPVGVVLGAAPGVLGAVLGAAPGVLGGAADIAGKARKAWGTLGSGEEDAAARAFTGKVAEKAEQGQKAAESTIKEADELTKQFEGLSEQQQRDLNKLAELRQQVADRRAQNGGNVPEGFSARRQMVEEMRAFREAAQRQGFSPEETATRVMAEQERVALAEAAADGLARDVHSLPSATPQEVGGKLQQAAKDIYEHGVVERRRVAGIDKVLEAAGRENKYGAESVVAYVDEELPHISSDAERAVLSGFRRKALGVKEEAADKAPEILPGETPSQAAARRAESQTAREAEQAEPGKMSLEKLESLRKDIASALQTRTIALENGNTQQVTAEMAHHLRAVYKRVLGEIKEQSPELSEALDRFRKASRPLDEFRTSMKDVIAGDLFNDEFRMGQAMVVDKMLSRSKQGMEPIARLVQERPELKEDLRRLFNGKLFGYGDKLPSAEAHARFLQQNENALRQAGLFEDFASLGEAKATHEATVARARAKYEATERVHEERLAAQEKRAAEGKARTERDIKEQGAKREKAEAAVKRYQKALEHMQSYMRDANPEPEKAVQEAGRFLDYMFENDNIGKDEYKQLLDELRNVEHQYKTHRDAKNFVTRVGNVVATTLAAAGLSQFGLHHLRSLKIW